MSGIVQGVGFRPFVYQLADRHGLAGEVANTASGVRIRIEGTEGDVDGFCRDLKIQAPPLSLITDISVRSIPAAGFTGFAIVKSTGAAERSTLISPDMCVCGDCLAELFDPADRRYRYPFINCTNCGPRYTIIDDIPYDRPHTSMRGFAMCPDCQAEYDDPVNRRFHAQPNACPACGPGVQLLGAGRRPVATEDPIGRTANLLRSGGIVAVKGLGGFHLAVDAENRDAVRRLRERKRREEKPFAVMSRDVERIRRYAALGEGEEALILSPRRPIVLLKKRPPHCLVDAVSPRNQYFGVMLPYTPLHYLLLDHGFTALVMTSGNLSEEPICIDNEDAFERLEGIADYFLVHNRDIYLRSDDSIVRRSAGETRFVRRSRGWVPVPVFLKKSQPSVLACGAELKNTVCLTKEDRAFVSQHIGDLENLETCGFLELTVGHLERILDVRPEIVACDLHPDYLSTRYAERQEGVEPVKVQHHHAHIVSCLAENRAEGPVIGLAFDGTGYGTDGCIWGGEVLIAETDRFDRVAHLDYVPMPGSAAAIKEPFRMAVSYLYRTFGEAFLEMNLPFLSGAQPQRTDVLIRMVEKGVNTPLTSSLGRLFDGVASIAGLRDRVRHEGQAAMELEMAAGTLTGDSYDYAWETVGGVRRILPEPIIRGVVEDIQEGRAVAGISARFHATLIGLFTDLCDAIRKETGLQRVALSGGSFQNDILLTGLVRELERRRFAVLTHTRVPANDGGISLGQAVAAAAMIKGGQGRKAQGKRSEE